MSELTKKELLAQSNLSIGGLTAGILLLPSFQAILKHANQCKICLHKLVEINNHSGKPFQALLRED